MLNSKRGNFRRGVPLTFTSPALSSLVVLSPTKIPLKKPSPCTKTHQNTQSWLLKLLLSQQKPHFVATRKCSSRTAQSRSIVPSVVFRRKEICSEVYWFKDDEGIGPLNATEENFVQNFPVDTSIFSSPTGKFECMADMDSGRESQFYEV